MNTVDYIRQLQATTSRLDKEQIILNAWMNGERDLFVGAKMAYDILMPFHNVKKVAEIQNLDAPTTPQVIDTDATFQFKDFVELAGKLHRRELTGNAAKAAIEQAALTADGYMWNEFMRRVLLKDLRAGVTETTFNKVLEKVAKSDATALDYLVPVWACALAKDGADDANKKHMRGKKLLDVKLDGVRLLTVVDIEAKTVTQYTRNGKENTNFPHVVEAFHAIMGELSESMVFDGEITARSFQELMTQVNTKDKANSDTRLALFDALPLADFKKGICKIRQEDRHTMLTGVIPVILRMVSSGCIYVIPKLKVDLDTPEGQRAFAEFNRETVEAGYEGIMVKNPDAPYELKRSNAWLKVKPFIEVSLTIVGYEEGTGKNVGKLGAWIMEGEDDGRQIKVNVGGGFSDKEREDYWINRDKYIGFIGEVRADVLSLEQGETVYSLRFPRWKGLRGTVPGEKL